MRKHFSTTVMGIFLFSVAVSTMPTFDVAAFFQNQERVIIQEQSFQKDPIEISEVLVGDKAIRFGEKFAASELWLKETALKLTNKHSKPVTYVQINVDFPEVLHKGVMMQHQMFLGRHPMFDTPVNSKPVRILPGESAQMTFDKKYEEIKRTISFLDAAKVRLVSKITLRFSEAGFEDGTIYSGGNLYRRNPDPDASRKWIKITE